MAESIKNDVEDFTTTGDAGTVPTSQGDGTLVMEEPPEPERVPNRSMIPAGEAGIFVIEAEDDQVVLRI